MPPSQLCDLEQVAYSVVGLDLIPNNTPSYKFIFNMEKFLSGYLCMRFLDFLEY